MKFKLMSAVVGTAACVTVCPFCVSGEKQCKENMIQPEVNWRNFDIACKLANRSGVDTVMLTGRGEPTLFPDQITDYLEHLQPYGIPFVELQTNAVPLENFKKYESYLRTWYDLGLTTITISVVSNISAINREIYTPQRKSYINLEQIIENLHKIGFTVRLTCICTKEWMSTEQQILDFIDYCKLNKVEQITLRPLNDEFRRETAKKWIDEHKMTIDDKEDIRSLLMRKGLKLLDLDRIGEVYDVDDQNVMFSHPLTAKTINTDPDNGRQLIFFQDGKIAYEWEHNGGRLL